MIKILNYKNSLSLKKLSTFLERRRFAENKDIGIVQNILKDIKVGDRFYTPYQEIEKSKPRKTIINSKGLKN